MLTQLDQLSNFFRRKNTHKKWSKIKVLFVVERKLSLKLVQISCRGALFVETNDQYYNNYSQSYQTWLDF